ncbi:Stk1 family PASTA domain-containing Ser/Thr kinase [Arthrobacter cavernae]|uniref:non-specific serine/threonine protein kinase n=1 Tax=Arthrobacter cavernae TaxID=2817681 RepID=A0A939HIB4_9MICC|nr:Stk1 family PASTA domain-containing Ser/Thr kinase [Arthrobacter cavernae]MBO1267980.1 Stk1 family PASTA domain-containing Ser/Thr kinase [Arthrobacter cavernae]
MSTPRPSPAHREDRSPAKPQHVLNGRYEVGELIGRGGMADVHRGVDTLLGRTIAVKILRADLARDPQFQARFKREAQAVAALNHPSIVAIYDTGEFEVPGDSGESVPVPFIVMEFVRGRTLRDMARAKELSIADSVNFALGVLSALEYSHKAGIVHRDIKPANVMVCEDTDDVKVMDFGIARAMADSAATMTQTQAVVGTAQYLSPEQARGEAVDARSDLYSAGCLLYETLTGRPPFLGDSPVSVAYQHVREIPEPASTFNPEVSEALDSVLAKALQKNRSDRFQDAAAFRRALRAASNGIAVPEPAAAEAPTDPTDVVPSAGLNGTSAGFLASPSHEAGAEAGDTAEDTLLAMHAVDDFADEEALPLGLPPERERSKAQKRRRRAWAATLVVFTLLVLAGGGFWIYSTVNFKAPPPPTSDVPSVSGMSEAQAIQEIYNAKLVPKTNRLPHDKISKGTAIGTVPDAGTSLERNSEVVLNISDGPSSVTIPREILGKTESSARDALRQMGMTGVISAKIANSATVPSGLVINTSPAPGAAVSVGAEVELVISSGKVAVPELRNLPKDEADALLKANGLAMAVVEQENAVVAPGTVTHQSDPADSLVEQGKTITVTVAKAPAPEPTPTPTATESKGGKGGG